MVTLARHLRIAAAARHRLRAIQERRQGSRIAGPKLLRAFAECFPQAIFVEIGANDGDQHDHLRPLIWASQWRGVMVEPVPYVFDRLRTNYADLDRVVLDNVAIADRDGELPFYYLAHCAQHEREGLPRWYDGIGSFSRDQVLDHRRVIPDIEDRLVEACVPCLTFESLCAKHGLRRIDLLAIDTEGYDYEILRHVNLKLHQPVLVVYEHYHLDREDRVASWDWMHQAGYETLSEGFDTWCLRPDADGRLTRIWRRLRPAFPMLTVEDEPR